MYILKAIPLFAVLRSKALKNVSLSDVTLDFLFNV